MYPRACQLRDCKQIDRIFNGSVGNHCPCQSGDNIRLPTKKWHTSQNQKTKNSQVNASEHGRTQLLHRPPSSLLQNRWVDQTGRFKCFRFVCTSSHTFARRPNPGRPGPGRMPSSRSPVLAPEVNPIVEVHFFLSQSNLKPKVFLSGRSHSLSDSLTWPDAHTASKRDAHMHITHKHTAPEKQLRVLYILYMYTHMYL